MQTFAGMQGIAAAEAQDGPYKGWPLGAVIALNKGTPVEEVRQMMLNEIDVQRADLDRQEAAVRALPTPVFS